MPRNDQETFSYLTAHASTSYEINLLTYAMFADEKAKWVEHHIQLYGGEPDEDTIRNWISNITDQHFDHMRLKAARYFDAAAREYLKNEFEDQKQQILNSAIIMEVKSAGSFWRQIGIAILTAVLAPIIIGGIIAAFLAYNKVFPTFVQVPTELQSGKTE